MNLDFGNVSTILFNNQQVGSIDINGVEAWRSQVLTPFYVQDTSGSENTLTIGKPSGTPTIVVEKSSNGINWESMDVVNDKIIATVPANGRLYLRCSTTTWNPHRISLSGNYEVGGNIMSLLYGSEYSGGEVSFPSGSSSTFANLFNGSQNLIRSSNLNLPATKAVPYCYNAMFESCISMVDTPVLPATELSGFCYQEMFRGCNALTTAPELPATTLYNECYSGMFYNCRALTTAPELPTTTLVRRCYQYMFWGCTSLNYIKCLATDISAEDCIGSWVNGVSQTGTFTKKAGVTYPSGVSGIPSGWTVIEV